jgi:DNA (cytosine-5)-methyltransferase 1
LKYLSVCSGIEAATVAWHPLGWEAVAYSEIEKFPSEVLAHHYPNTPNVGDMTKFKEWNLGSNVDLLVGGTPCQSFSVAGLRKGLDDPRGNLMLTYLAIAKQHRPNWLVWENVPGVLSSNGGRDFGSFLGGLAECGYGFAYRVLDAQYFGVAQRRRRVFVVGHLGDWRAAAAVLFERHSLQGHPAPSREKKQAVAASAGASAIYGGSDLNTADTVTSKWAKGSGGPAGNECGLFVAQPIVVDRAAFNQGENAQYQFRAEHSETMDSLVARGPHAVLQPVYKMHGQDSRVRDLGDTCSTVTSKWGTGGGNVPVALQPICLMDQGGSVMSIEHDITGTLRRETHGHEPIVIHGTQDPCVSDIAFAQGRNNGGENVLVQAVGTDLYNLSITGDVAACMSTAGSTSSKTGTTVMQAMAVRRLTPVECERLQGFGDNYTNIKSKGKPTPDGPRYKALGNSMAVPVMAWIGARIQQYEDMQ